MNMINHDTLLTAISADAAGDAAALTVCGIDNEYIHDIRALMNIYSHLHATSFVDILACCIETHAPAEALDGYAAFMERTGYDFSAHPVGPDTARILASVFSASNALSRRLNGDPSLVALLDGCNSPFTDSAYYRDCFLSALEHVSYPADKRRAVHRVHTVQLSRICARNCMPGEDIAIINRELSLLADSVIDTCLALAFDELALRLEIGQKPHRLVVLGLGKLGGGELNVSSDIDLIYLCDDTEETWGRYDTVWFHTMLAEQLTRTLTEMTDLGILYRVDTRLRADGASGPLVRTTVEYFRYLEMRGEAWERQMLVKARPVAGDVALGGEFLGSLERFIFPTSISRSPHREIVALKTRIESRLERGGNAETHLKLMPGGIRDIEFTTQCLQLLMGGMHPEVRSPATIEAIERLHGAKALSDDEYRILSDAYRLYRRIENARQWRELLAAFTIPGDGGDADNLAVFLGYAPGAVNSGELLIADIQRCLKQVRDIYEDVFSTETAGSSEEMALYAAMHPAGDEGVRRFLESLGFTDPDESAKTLSRLAFGETLDVPEADVPATVQRFIPVLLNTLADLPDPTGALERFQHIVAAYRARTTLFGILVDNEPFFSLLVSIAHASVFISNILVADPSLLDWLVESGGIGQPLDRNGIDGELNRLNRRHRDTRQFSCACRALKFREKLRIGARDISGLATTAETFDELTGVAESIVRAVYDRVMSDTGEGGDFTFCVMAAGRLGAGTMNFGSDIDLIFVYDIPAALKDDVGIPEATSGFAQMILRILTGGGGAAKVYDVDARLRPEGGSATLTVSLDAYRRYLDQRASVWERLALVRARPVAGDAKLCGRVSGLFEEFVYAGRLSAEDIDRITGIRARMVKKALSGGTDAVNVKTGPGGIADIDFIAQTYAVHYGATHPNARKRDTAAILNALAAEHLLEPQAVATLIEQYGFLNDLDKALRIGSGRSTDTLLADEREMARVTRLLGFKNVRRFRKRLGDAVALTRELYEGTMARLTVSERK